MAETTADALVRAWFEEVWNQGRADRIDTYLDDQAMVHRLDESGAHAVGPSGFRPFFEKFRAAFPDIRFTLDAVVASGDQAAVRWTATLTHSGDGLGITATGKAMTLTGMGFARVQDGKIVEAWNEWDRLGLATALGTAVAAR